MTNIIKRLTAMTSLTVCLGILTPMTAALAKVDSTNDSHAIKNKAYKTAHVSDTTARTAAGQSANRKATIIFGNDLIQQGDSGPIVAKLQNELQRLGYYNGDIDGVLSNQTFKAVRAFTSDHQHGTSAGLVGADTKTALYMVYRQTDEAKENEKRLAEMIVQEKKAAEERAQKAAEAKAAARKAAQEAAKDAAEAAAKRAQANKAKKATKIKTSYHPSKKQSVSAVSSGRSITVEATSYSLGGRTATGINLSSNPNARVIAVDPSVIPLGSRVLIPGLGVYTAGDTGGAIKGKRIDVHVPTARQAAQFGRRTLTITILR